MDLSQLDELLKRANVGAERPSIISEGHLVKLAVILAREDENELQLLALEIVFRLTLESALRPHIAAVDGLLASIKSLQSRGRLKQKRVAINTAQNLQGVTPFGRPDAFSPLSEIAQPVSAPTGREAIDADEETEESNDENPPAGTPMSPLLVGKRGGRGARVVGRSGFPESKARPPSASAAAAVTMALFVENLHNADVRQRLENCLLKKEGVLSILTDLQEEKVTVRTTLTIEALQAQIWEHCHARATLSKGDYSTFKATGYLDEQKGQSGGWLSGLSNLLQIIAVKPDQPAPAKAAPQKAATGGGGGKQGGWLGSWW